MIDDARCVVGLIFYCWDVEPVPSLSYYCDVRRGKGARGRSGSLR